ncbi:MAG TPA: amidohydrolase family protein, partial [Ktedonobacterales bacterium]|nr:amidohydrolase family protein [Ktedonobacterales bacterium]
DDWLRLATLGGAEALGLDHELGSLTEGKCAEMACARLDGLGEDERRDSDLVLLALVEGRLAVGALPA